MDPAFDTKGENDEKSEHNANDIKSETSKSKHCGSIRTRMNRSQRIEQQKWLREYQMRKQRYNAIDRQLKSIFSDRNLLWNEMKDILDWKELMKSQRHETINFLSLQITQNAQFVCQFQQCFEHIESNPKYLEKITCLANQIEQSFSKMKLNIFNTCSQLEKVDSILYKELLCHSERFDTWEKSSNRLNSTAPVQSNDKKCQLNATNVVDSRPNELIEIDKMLNEFGPNGGWSRQDHNDFLKLSTQIKNDDKQLLSQLMEILPHYSLTDIRRHLEWYATYQRLWKQKKIIIKKWKKENNLKKEKESQSQKSIKQKMIDKEKKNEKEMIKQRMKTKLAIKQWKQAKKEKQLRLQKEQLIKQEKMKKIKKKQLNERILKNQLLIHEIQTQNKLKQFSQSCQNICNKPFSSRMTTLEKNNRKQILMEKFQIKDSQLLQQRMLLKEKKSLQEKQRKEKLNELIKKSTPNIVISKDTLRLSSMTSSVAQRYHQKNINKENTSEKTRNAFSPRVNLDSVSVRATPSWRKGL